MNDALVEDAGNLFVVGWLIGTVGIGCGIVLMASPSWFFLGLFLGLILVASVLLVTAIILVAHELGGLNLILEHSAYRDPSKQRVNGRWVQVDDPEDLVGQLEELQEASR